MTSISRPDKHQILRDNQGLLDRYAERSNYQLDNLGYYDRDGLSISAAEWSVLHADMSYKRVAQNYVMTKKGPVLVSTVWLGMDHGYGSGKPIIFETMIFADDKKLNDQMWRYSNEEDAIKGHHFAVELVKGKIEKSL